MRTISIFIASSSELKEDRDQFRMFVSRENDRLHKKGIYLKVVQWENFLDTLSDTRMQDEYNAALRQCDLVVCLFFTKVGRFSEEEFDTAYELFKNEGKPKIWTYFKDAAINTGSIDENFNSLLKFKKKLADLGHFYTQYTNIDNLINQYKSQLEHILPEYETQKPDEKEQFLNKETKTQENPVQENNFNQHLTKVLLSTSAKHNRKAASFLSENPEWKKNEHLTHIAKQLIISSFVGVIGVQLRKLISIGNEKPSKSKYERYFENCELTVKRSLQLLNYTLISKLWDYRISGTYAVKNRDSEPLLKFFKSSTPCSITNDCELTQELLAIFKEDNLENPIPESEFLAAHLDQGQQFKKDCNALQDLREQTNLNELKETDCLNAEKHVTAVLEHLGFFGAYRMISLKDINYSKQRNDKQGLYLHNYTYLAGDSRENNLNQTKVRKENSPIMSFAVLLFRDNYREHINLDPFVIDYNGLALTGGSKICFYSHCNTYSDHKLNYTFIEDNSLISFKDSGNPKPDDTEMLKVNRWLADPENRKNLNFDKVYELFFEAKEGLLGVETETPEDFF